MRDPDFNVFLFGLVIGVLGGLIGGCSLIWPWPIYRYKQRIADLEFKLERFDIIVAERDLANDRCHDLVKQRNGFEKRLVVVEETLMRVRQLVCGQLVGIIEDELGMKREGNNESA